MAKLIFGCGYLGSRVARMWREAGHEVTAVTRSPVKASQLASQGLRPIVADLLNPDSLSPVTQLAGIDTVLFAVGYDRSGSAGSANPPTIHDVYVKGLAHAITALPSSAERLIYISSTGVYGQVEGDWVDETSPCQPLREGGLACLDAERLLVRQCYSRAIVLRLAGLYGPGRIPRAKDLQAGAAIAAPSSGYLNLIHVEDAARIVLLAEAKTRPPKLYCVSDGQPVLRGEYYAELARLLGAPPPKFIEPPADSPAAQRAASDKRVSNTLLMTELAPTFLYPSYREGLAEMN